MEAARVRCVACCASAVLDRPIFLHTLGARFRVADTLWGFRHHLGAHTTCSKHGPLPDMIADYRAVSPSVLQCAPPPPPHISYSYFVLRLLSQQLVTYTFLSPGSQGGSDTYYFACSGQAFRFYYFVF